MSAKESASSKQWPRVLPWLDVTGGFVLMLLVVQFLTGVALAFYYVPSVDHAHTTVSFIEKVLSSGSWLRSLHHHGSQWLPLFVFLHLVRLRSCGAYKHWKIRWVTTVLLLGLVLAAGATGYSLPWDARAFFGTRVAEGLVGGLPFVGRNARLWLLGGPGISTLTLSRLFALHVLVTPFAILIIVGWRSFREDYQNASWTGINRNIIAAGIGFLFLAIWSLKFPAPLGPAVTEVTSDYLPRPGAQFLWLFQTLKYLPGGLGSLAGIVLPGLALVILLLIPWLDLGVLRKFSTHPQRIISNLILAILAFWVLTMTMTAYLSDWRNLGVRQQLAKQAAAEKAFRSAPFRPVGLSLEDGIGPASETAPKAYLQFCANCHGRHGEGATQGQLRFPPLIGVAAKPQRTVSDIVALLNDPTAFGLEPPMRSFATKLTETEKQEIAGWVVKLK